MLPNWAWRDSQQSKMVLPKATVWSLPRSPVDFASYPVAFPKVLLEGHVFRPRSTLSTKRGGVPSTRVRPVSHSPVSPRDSSRFVWPFRECVYTPGTPGDPIDSVSVTPIHRGGFTPPPSFRGHSAASSVGRSVGPSTPFPFVW